jgi:hypothetical protein
MSGSRSAEPGQRSLVRGIWRLARLDRAGFAEFAGTPQAFLSSLAPLVAFPLVGGLLMLLRGMGLVAVTDLLATLVMVLAPPVISEALARRWGRGAAWLRFAVAFNWTQWAVPVVGTLLLLVAGVLRVVGLSDMQAVTVWLFGVAGYAIALHWFLARQGLGVSRGQAVLFLLGVNLGTALLVFVPRQLGAGL